MCEICPKCGAIAEFNAYYERTTCTRCNWEGKKEKQQRELIPRLNYAKKVIVKKSISKIS